MSSEESATPNQQWNMGGKLIIKVQLNDDIRRVPIHNEDITYDELVLMMQRVFRGKLTTTDDVLLKYKDEDGDLITIFDSSDLTGAIQSSRTLKLTIFLNNKTETVEPEEKPSPVLANINSIRKELMAIRDQVIRVLDKIEPVASLDAPNGETASAPVEQQRENKPVHPTIIKPAINAGEFDPIQQQQQHKQADVKPVLDNNKLYESFGVAAENAVTDGPLTPKPQGLQPSMMQQQGMMGHPQQQQQQQQPLPPMGSPYQQPSYQSSQPQPPMGQQQLRFQPPQTSTGYSLPVQQQGPAYPQAGGYSPQPPQQQQQPSTFAPGSMPYAPQASQQQQATPTYNGPSQGYNPVQQPQQQPAGMTPYPSTAAYPPSNTAPPTNPYSRGAQPATAYASRPQPLQQPPQPQPPHYNH